MFTNEFVIEVIDEINAFGFYFNEHIDDQAHHFDVGHPRHNNCDPLCLVAEITKVAVEYDCREFNYDGRNFHIVIENKTFQFHFVDGWAND